MTSEGEGAKVGEKKRKKMRGSRRKRKMGSK
jgi:hypothetical protein